MTDKNTEECARSQLRKFLPGALHTALESYRMFMMMERNINESKKYGEHQKAGRIAIGHVDLLFRLAKNMEEEGELSGEEDLDMLKGLMQQAKQSSDEYHAQHDDNDLV